MTDSKPGVADAQSRLISLPLTAMQAGAELFERRARALGSYWTSVVEARQPADLVQAGAEYWSHLLEDYAGAMTRGAEGVIETGEALRAAETAAPVPAGP